MNFEKIFKMIKMLTYVAIAGAGLGVLLLIIGIIASSAGFVVFGLLFIIGGIALFFYVYPETAKYQKIKKARDYILDRDCVTDTELATVLGVTETKARGIIDVCFRKGCVTGYVRKGQKIFNNQYFVSEQEKAGKITVAIDCPNCGANFKGIQGQPNECPYCRSFVNA